MSELSGFKEMNETAERCGEDQQEISREAMDSFSIMMGDRKTPDVRYAQEERSHGIETQFDVMEQFESLFRGGKVVLPELRQPTERDMKKRLEEDDPRYQPNTRYVMGEGTCETDDNGKIYKRDGELLPNTEYTVNGSTYRTNEYGNIISCDTVLTSAEESGRNTKEQREAGGEDRREGDQGGHLIARTLGGAEGDENLVPMRGTINQGDYKRMENEIKDALKHGETVSVHIELQYDGDSSRPSRIDATYVIDGKKTEVLFDNEVNSTRLVDSLEGRIPDSELSRLKEEIGDMREDGREVSVTSVKTEYNEDGTVAKVTVGVRDEAEGNTSYKVYDAH